MQHFDSCKHYCFRSILIFSLSFLFLGGYGQVFTVDSIMRNGSRNNRINYAYMSDGYLNAELPLFITNATAINTSLFNTTPFKEYKNYFNSFAIRVPSAEAGAKLSIILTLW